jgi:hypothetical protein
MSSGAGSVAAGLGTRGALERVAGLHRRAAAIFRANGLRAEAVRAEQFAARTRLILDESKATRRMHALAQTLYEVPDPGSLLERALDGAMSLVTGDFANVQIRDLTSARLRIAAQYGFGSEFLEYFANVEDDTSACGRAADQRSQTVIVDVNRDVQFTPHREIAAASGFRAVQSTPLIDPAGRLRGVISTHFRRPHCPPIRDLQLVQWYAEHVAAALADQQNPPTTLREAAAALHARTASLHDDAAARITGTAQPLLTNGDQRKALAAQDRALRAIERAKQERQRARALTARASRPAAAPVAGPHPPRV